MFCRIQYTWIITFCSSISKILMRWERRQRRVYNYLCGGGLISIYYYIRMVCMWAYNMLDFCSNLRTNYNFNTWCRYVKCSQKTKSIFIFSRYIWERGVASPSVTDVNIYWTRSGKYLKRCCFVAKNES